MRRLAAWLTLTLAFSVTAGCSGLQHESKHSDLPAQLRVLTYNIHHGEGVDGRLDLERIGRLISESAADLVALQEVDRETKRAGGIDQLRQLADLTGYHPYFAEFFPYQGGRYGLAILARHPALSERVIELPPGKLEPRKALAVELELEGGARLTFVCAHLDWLEPDTQRLAQAATLADELERTEGPVILAGDLNDVPGSRSLAALCEVLSYSPRAADQRLTFPSEGPAEEIDYVLTRLEQGQLFESVVLDERVASDHRPVLATFIGLRLD